MREMGRQLLLLHGAGLGGWVWHRVQPLLSVSAQAVDLPGRGQGADPRSVSFRDAVDHLVALLLAADEPYVIVAHSFSAQIALAAASEQPQAVRAIVLVGGMIPRTGKNFLSLMPRLQRLALGVVMRLSRHGVTVPRDVAMRGFGPDLDIATMQLVLDRLVPEVPRFYLDPVDWSPLPPEIPVIYVRLLRDQSVNLTTQGEQAKLVRATRIETIESGHLPMLSRPTEMAEILNRVATQLT